MNECESSIDNRSHFAHLSLRLQIVMSSDTKVTLPQAQEEFLNIVRKLSSEDELKQLLSWIKCNWSSDWKVSNEAEEILSAIASDLRTSLPLEAILPTERIRPPTNGKNSDCESKHTVHVDAFLYDDEQVDALCEEGKLARSYCLDCGSHNTQPLTYISHSMSRERLLYIFKSMLSPLDNKVILDVGSRLGAVLYGAYLYSKAERILGVEMNHDLCELQNELIKKYKFQNRIQVVEADIASRRDLILAADVIIMNNVFEFFMDSEPQIAIWRFLRETMKPGTVLVTIPPLEDTFSSLQIGFDLEEWVQELPLYNADGAGVTLSSEEMLELKHYHVL